MEKINHYQILANSSVEALARLATFVLEKYPASQIKILSGPRQGLVMLRMRESVANSQFNAGEILVTEVKLELDGQFGFGTIIGDSARRAMAVALLDAAIRKGGPVASQLEGEIAQLGEQLQQSRQRMHDLVASSKVEFENF